MNAALAAFGTLLALAGVGMGVGVPVAVGGWVGFWAVLVGLLAVGAGMALLDRAAQEERYLGR